MKRLILLQLAFLLSFYFVNAQEADSIIEKKIDVLIKQMTLDEKVRMCHANSKFSSRGVPRLGIPDLKMSDGPHGVRAEISWATWDYAKWTNDSVIAFPALTCLAATFNPQMAYEYGVALGEEARFRNKDIILAPGVNIYRHPLNGRNFEYMGEDPLLAAQMAVPYIKGVQSIGVAACIKHFALNNQERWRGHINVKVSDRALYEIYLPAFKAACQEGDAWTLMGAYNKYNSQHCSHNDFLLNKVLKKDWGYKGVVMSDWNATHNTLEAANNGLDIEMGTWGKRWDTIFDFSEYYLAKPFEQALLKGEVSEDVLNDKVRRILRLCLKTNMRTDRPIGKIGGEHSIIARNIAREGIVLLKNNNQMLPLDASKTIKIAVIGENAVKPMTPGGGSSELKALYEVSPLDGIQKRFKNAAITYSRGYESPTFAWGKKPELKFNADSLAKAAIEAASKADLVIFVGGLNKNFFQDSEGGDRKSMDLPYNQDSLINEILKVNPNMLMVLLTGNAVSMPWINKVPAIVQAWYIGSEAGNVIADVISGDVNPSGKLPFTFPVKLEDCPAIRNGAISYPGDSINQEYKEGIYVGYRWYLTQKIKPLFPFGYGLSYTTFDIKPATSGIQKVKANETFTIKANITNTGKVKGSEVLQLYVRKPKSVVDRPLRELRAFKKVALEPGQTSTVELSVAAQNLSFYDEKKGSWTLEPGEYLIEVGTSAENILFTNKISVE
ncbi:MAG TPA: glycoside hydrolase family 3 C-terminal domain-containing protein [Bacteroidales bacterium]|nr:glycoside hydrolase family 3 C-terminal domain-containing protein [Bacteroidales bacterium]